MNHYKNAKEEKLNPTSLFSKGTRVMSFFFFKCYFNVPKNYHIYFKIALKNTLHISSPTYTSHIKIT